MTQDMAGASSVSTNRTAEAPARPVISFAFLTHNEKIEFAWLMEALAPVLTPENELVILDDYSDQDMVDLLRRHASLFAQRPLNRNFGAQRNHLKGMCSGRYIVTLDPDEMPDPHLLEVLPQIVMIMERDGLDIVEVPRLSRPVATDGPVDARTLTYSQAELEACAPAYQARILRNIPKIRYINRVHERLIGVRRAGRLPMQLRYALYHVTSERRRAESRRFYRSIRLRYLDKWRKSLTKRFGLMPEPERVAIKVEDLEAR